MGTDPDTRRQFLKTLALGGGATLLTACARGPSATGQNAEGATAEQDCAPEAPPLPDGLNPENFHIHNQKPLAIETKRSSLLSGIITPASLLFVRNNLPMPSASILDDRDSWVLDVKGVERPGPITLAELKRLGRETTTAVLQCSGNGRAFFEHSPSGSQWAVGAAGCVNWTGVRLSALAAHLGGPTQDMKYVTATGGETLPEGVDRDAAVVERSIPIAKGLDDVLLAWEMNGQPIPITHGGPLRMVVPGYFGCNQIKYVKTIAFALETSQAKIMKSGYRYRPIGEKGNPNHDSMWRMPVKSWVNGPGADDTEVLSGRVHFHGVAFSGERGIRSVEVSMDDGKTWVPAELYGPDMGKNAWRTFRYATDLAPGTHRIVSRATDTSGETQPELREENERGYGYNGWAKAGLDVRVVSERTQTAPAAGTPTESEATNRTQDAAPHGEVALTEAGERGKAVFTAEAEPNCGVCHTLADAETAGITGPNLNELAPNAEKVVNAVTNGVGVMPGYGETLSSDQIANLATYVVEATR